MTSKIKHHQVMKDLVLSVKPKRFIEIGVWKGHLIKRLLKSECNKIITEYWGIDPWEVLTKGHGRMSNLDAKTWYAIYMYCCGLMAYFPQLKIVKTTSLEAAKLFKNNYFDMVFIDASHFCEDVLDDILIWIPKIKKGGYITGHDYGIGHRRRGWGVKFAVDSVFDEDQIEVRGDSVWVVRLE